MESGQQITPTAYSSLVFPVTLVSLKTGVEDGVETAKLELSDGAQFSVKTCYLNEQCPDLDSWELDREVSPEESEALDFASACLKAERAAMRLIARAEQRRWGLNAKLEQRGFDSACIKIVIQRFLDLNLLNDRRYAEIWLRNRLARRGGKAPSPRELKAMLQNRGIDRETAAEAIQNILNEEEEQALLERFLRKKDLSGADSLLRRQLRAEGFSPEVLQRFFDE